MTSTTSITHAFPIPTPNRGIRLTIQPVEGKPSGRHRLHQDPAWRRALRNLAIVEQKPEAQR